MEQRFFNNHPHALPSGGTTGTAPLALHQRLPGYAPTPLLEAPQTAAQLGVGKLWVKDESCRLGLPAFKILGASWAVYRALERHAGGFAVWDTLDALRAQVAPLLPLTLTAATDGNHGRAVARMARLLGCAAHIFVPVGMAQARIDALQGEGAEVTVVHGTYDEAVAESAKGTDARRLVISDTSWPGYEAVPSDVIAGYTTMFAEVDAELARRGEQAPDVVIVQMGVGALAAAVVQHYRSSELRIENAELGSRIDEAQFSILNSQFSISRRPIIIGVEPTSAACVLASMQAGQIVEVLGPHDSIMSGLNCGTPSLIAWPWLRAGIDVFVTVEDERARQAMRALAAEDITAGETGAAGVAGLAALLVGPEAADTRARLGITPTSHVLTIVTEGATDPVAYTTIVGQPAKRCGVQKQCSLCAPASVTEAP